ncbi:MAG: hypothetical protein GY708_24930 [Actinomycetia bacterium]|nr:hypothetical protein [Actinomycetes bacterium]
METLRQQWRDGDVTLGGWLSSASSTTAESMARTALDYVCVDMQHGTSDYASAVGQIQAIIAAGGTPIVRVPWNEQGIIGKVLDAGALGVIVPMVNSPAEAEAVVSACRYAPRGSRSFGPILAAPRVVGNYVDWSRDNIAVIPMIETAQAVDDLDAILDVEGIDAVYVGPADLSLTYGLPPGNNDDEPQFTDALTRIVESCNERGIVAGIHANGKLTPRRLAAGFRMVTVASDVGAMGIGIQSELREARATDGPGHDAVAQNKTGY